MIFYFTVIRLIIYTSDRETFSVMSTHVMNICAKVSFRSIHWIWRYHVMC